MFPGTSHSSTIQAFGNRTARFDVINVFYERYEIGDGVGAPQFGIRRAFFSGLTRMR
jgi:hypothetical protein